MSDENRMTGSVLRPGVSRILAVSMSLAADYAFPTINADKDIAIISPGNVEDMRRLPGFYREKGVPYIFDPGQQLPVLTGNDLLAAIEGSFACITNDYELNM